MGNQAMKRLGGTLNAYYKMKEANLKRLYDYNDDTVEKL